MLGKVLGVVAVGTATAYLLRTGAAREQYARLITRSRTLPVPGRRPAGTVPALVDRRPQALETASTAPALLPDATPAEIAWAVQTDQVRLN